MPSLTIENYVKAIYQLCDSTGQTAASTGKIAESLGVSPGTVTSMLKTLSESGLASYTPYEGVSLSQSGQLLALRVIRRHRLIELFLVRTLSLAWDEVHAEAEHMEHAVSEFLVDRIDAFLGFPEFDPHGDPIPKADGTIAAAEGFSLLTLPPGTRFRLQRVCDQSPDLLRYLAENGLNVGTSGLLVSSHPKAGVVIRASEKEITLPRAVAETLQVVME